MHRKCGSRRSSLEVPITETLSQPKSPPTTCTVSESQNDTAASVVDSASLTSTETPTVDTTVSAETPSQPTAASNVEDDLSPKTIRPSCFVSMLPTFSVDTTNSTAFKNNADEDRRVPGSRQRVEKGEIII